MIFIPPKIRSQVIDIVAAEYGVSVKDIRGKSRQQKIVRARQMYVYIISGYKPKTEIAKELNITQRTSITYFIKKVEEWLILYQDTKEHYQNIVKTIRTKHETKTH
ncbi:MAG: helix-turn-helix domain-containing protein [Cyclobacteriaceae bacterium]